MFGFDVVTELSLALDTGEFAGFVLRNGVSPVENRVTRLDEEQVELDWIARIDVAIRKEVLATQQDRLALVDALLPQRFRVIHPVNYLKLTFIIMEIYSIFCKKINKKCR